MTDLVNALGFSDDEIQKCGGGLLSIELEFTRQCNLRCLYCYTEAGKAAKDELTLDELQSVVFQAKDLGAKKIILLGGGEPLIYDGLIDIVDYIDSLGLQQVIFTNGTLIRDEIANHLFKRNVSVIIKQNSFDPGVQDELAGVEGAFWRIKRGMGILREAGYPDGKASLGIQTVICRQNVDEIPRMWVWARERNIIPYVEILTFQGRARSNSSLLVSSERTKALFEQLEAIDNARFDIQWKTRPTIAAFSCKRHLYSSLVTAQGNVQPCTGVDISVGNIRENSLKEILAGSTVIRRLRNVYEHLEGKCRDCRHSRQCYGCRGNAYQMTGNYLASDPTCWHCERVRNENPVYLCKQ
jgi:radical SAM protein with 4Fe4S-binding SPASM domain